MCRLRNSSRRCGAFARLVIVISAATVETVSGLIEMAEAIAALEDPKPVFGFGGGVFNAIPNLRVTVPGVFMGEHAQSAVANVSSVLAERRK